MSSSDGSIHRFILIAALLIPLLAGITLRVLPLSLPFVDDEVQSRIDAPLLASLTEKVVRENPTLPAREQAVLAERAFQRATNAPDYRALRDGAIRFYKDAVKDDTGWYLPSNEAYQWYQDASFHPTGSGYAFLLRVASLLFPLRSVVLFMPVVLAALAIVLVFFLARFFTPSLFGQFFAALLAAMHPLFLAKTIPGGGHEAFFVVELLILVLLLFIENRCGSKTPPFSAPIFDPENAPPLVRACKTPRFSAGIGLAINKGRVFVISFSRRPLFHRCAAGAGVLLLAFLLVADYFRVVGPAPIIPLVSSLSLRAWIESHHLLVFLTGVAGSVVLFWSGKRWHGLLCSSWIAGSILFSLFIGQTTLFIFPLLTFASAVAVGAAADWCAVFARAHLHVPARVGQVLAGVLILLIFIPSLLAVPEFRPVYDDEWHAVLRAATSNLPADARIAAWGNDAFLTVVSGRRVVSDSPAGRYWLARALAANETSAVAIFRMLACREEPTSPAARLSSPDSSCSPPPLLLVVDENLIKDAPAWTQLGRWDFEKAAIWDAYRASSDLSSMMNRFNYSADKQRDIQKQLGLLLSDDEVRAWIGPSSSYRGEAECDPSGRCTLTTATRAIVFQLQGHEVTIENARTQKLPASVVWVDESGFHERFNSGDTAAFSIGIMQKKNETRLIIFDSAFATSVATRLLFYNASGLPSFTPIASTRSLTGGDITIWRVVLQ